MQQCHVPPADQERVLQGYMMNHMLHKNGTVGMEEDEDNVNAVPDIPEAVERLPGIIREEVIHHARAEAIRRRDPAFAHSSPGKKSYNLWLFYSFLCVYV